MAASSRPPSSAATVHPARNGSHVKQRHHRAAWDSSGVPPPPRVRPNRSVLDEPEVKPRATVRWRQPRSQRISGRMMRSDRMMM